MRLRRFVLVGVTLAIVAPAAMQAPQLPPCTPLAPGARCATKPTPNVWQVDFGAPKPVPAPPQWDEPSHWQAMGHRPMTTLLSVPPLQVPALLDHSVPIDCKMAKPGDPAVDPKIVAPHPGHTLAVGRVITVAPCKSK